MINLLRRIRIEWHSYWIGFFTSLVFVWLASRFLPFIKKGIKAIKEQTENARQGLVSESELKYRKELYRYVQANHIAANLFSLDEILIETHILPPKLIPFPGEEPPPEDVTTQSIPYTPDFPELATAYNMRYLTLDEAMSEGANILLMGQPGSGKTVALSALTSRVLIKEPRVGALAEYIPIFLHASELNLPIDESQKPIDIIIKALTTRHWKNQIPKLEAFLKKVFRNNKVLLLLDGLDELPQETIDSAANFLERLFDDYPEIRSVIAAPTDYIGKLPSLNLVPLSIMPWNDYQKETFVKQWKNKWETFIEENSIQDTGNIDYLLLNSWILQNSTFLSPLEFVLKVWTAYSNDLVGLRGKDYIESYIARISHNIPGAREALQWLAYKIVNETTPFLNIASLGNEKITYSENNSHRNISLQKVIPNLLNRGILVQDGNRSIRFIHPVIAGFIAADYFIKENKKEALFKQPEWIYKTNALHYLVAKDSDVNLTHQHVSSNDELFQQIVLSRVEWLRDMTPTTELFKQIFRDAAIKIKQENIPLSTRAKILINLAKSNFPGVSTLLIDLLNIPFPETNQLAALGLGFLRERKAVSELINALHKPLSVQRAICLALINTGTKQALEAVANVLLHGNEALQRAAAEAFANHPREGYPVLKEGTQIDDLLVRRAVIFGLKRINEPWVIDLLENIQLQEGQWVVRDAAEQALQELTRANPYIPRKRPPLNKTPWLITYAKENDIPLTTDKNIKSALFQAFRNGNTDEKIAALYTLLYSGEDNIFPTTYHMLFGDNPEQREAASFAIWYLHILGKEIPPLAKYGFG